MRSHVKLLSTVSVNTPSSDQRRQFTNLVMPSAHAKCHLFKDFSILTQSLSHYISHIELYECSTKRDSDVEFEVTKDSIFLIAMHHGSVTIHDEAEEIIPEIYSQTCTLIFLKTGKYRWTISEGPNQILLFNIRPAWLLKRYSALVELSQLIQAFKGHGPTFFCLPRYNMGNSLFKLLLSRTSVVNPNNLDTQIYIFINECVNSYLVKLHSQAILSIEKQNKSLEIAEFVVDNYSSPIVSDEAALANHFGISPSMLVRLIKWHFGAPLHQKVIELRMLNGLKLLLTTKKTVTEISRIVGYDDPKYFGRAFKKKFGITANELRFFI